MNKKTIFAAGVVFLLALSAMAVFASAKYTMSATPCLDDSGGDDTTVDREPVPKEIHRRVPIEIHEDPGSYDVVDGAGGLGFSAYDFK